MGDVTKYLEIYIDGVPLQQMFAEPSGVLPDEISPLGWAVPGAEEFANEQFRRFLLMSPSDLPENRNSILVCPLDADLGCGAFSARFYRTDLFICWSDFGFEYSWVNDSIDLETYKHIAPFIFDWSQYEEELLSHSGFHIIE